MISPKHRMNQRSSWRRPPLSQTPRKEGVFDCADTSLYCDSEGFGESHYYVEQREATPSSEKIGKSMHALILFVISNGIEKQVILSGEDIESRPIIEVNGYLTAILSLGKNKMKIQYGENTASRMVFDPVTGRVMATSNYEPGAKPVDFSVIGSNWLSGKAIEKLVADDLQNRQPDNEDGFYQIGSFDPTLGDPLISCHGKPAKNPKPVQNHLTLHAGGETLQIPIAEQPARKCGKLENLHFFYEGNDVLRLRSVKHLRQRLNSLLTGIKKVSATFNYPPVERLYLRDYWENNANVNIARAKINIFMGLLSEGKLRHLRVTGEHEFLHSIAFHKGLTNNLFVRKIFCDLKQFDPQNREQVYRTGRPCKFTGNDRGAVYFFSFIDECNFLHRGDRASGHSYDDVYEFTASFLHTLMYMHRFEKNLGKPVYLHNTASTPNGLIAPKTLTFAEKLHIVDAALKSADAFVNALQFPVTDPANRSLIDFLNDRIGKLEIIRARLLTSEVTEPFITIKRAPSPADNGSEDL
jgi:hypothetical protein